MTAERFDLGEGHWLEFFRWDPDRELNPQYADIPAVERYGAFIYHPRTDATECCGSIIFDTAEVRRCEAASRAQSEKLGYPICGHDMWQVQSWEPLTISPSVLCSCGDHGFIREGRWVPA